MSKVFLASKGHACLLVNELHHFCPDALYIIGYLLTIDEKVNPAVVTRTHNLCFGTKLWGGAMRGKDRICVIVGFSFEKITEIPIILMKNKSNLDHLIQM